LTFIISFDGTNGFGKKNHIQTFIEAQVKPPPGRKGGEEVQRRTRSPNHGWG